MIKKILIFYVVTKKHIENLRIIEKKFKDYQIFYVFEKYLNLIDKDDLIKNNLNYIYDYDFEKFLYEKKNLIKLILFSTGQPRNIPINIFYHSIIQNIKTISFQETNQFFLHEGKINNYLLPTDKYFLLSNFEVKSFIDNNYDKSKLFNIGIFYNYECKLLKTNIKISNDQKKVLLILNASNKIYYNSSETKSIQINLINAILKVLPKNHQLLVKQHPAESFNFNFRNKKIYLCDNNSDILNIINESNLILTTGYTQSIFDAIDLNKKIVFIKIINNRLFNYIDSKLIYTIDNIKNIFNNDYSFKIRRYKKLIDTNINFSKKNSLKLVIDEISNLLYEDTFTKSNYDLIEFYLWLVFSNKILESKRIYNLLIKKNINDEFILKILSLIKKVAIFKLSLINCKYIFNYFKGTSIQNILIFFIIKNIYINKLEINSDYLNFFIKLPQIFTQIYFKIEIKIFLNYIYLNDIDLYIELTKLNHFNFFIKNYSSKLSLYLMLNKLAFKNRWYRKLIIYCKF